ncbi:MAG: DoxX family protein [Aureispira sp.]|nr:DoxX family protein [Aureispira sp.]
MQNKVELGARILLGAMMVFFGLNKFTNWVQPPLSGEALDFMGHLATAGGGYIMKIVAIVEILTGLLMLSGFFVPLAAVLLFPIMLNAFLFHLFLDPAGIGGAAVAMLINIYLFFAHKSAFNAILQAKPSTQG